MNPIIIIQARMGSKRFPGKALAPLNRRPMIDHILAAATEAEIRTLVALPMAEAGDGPLIAYLDDIGVEWDAAAPENDVLGRFIGVLRSRPEHDVIVRLTADCPLVDHRTIVELVDERASRGVPYLGRTNDPDGNDVEVFTRDALLASAQATDPHMREHVTTFMRAQPMAMMSHSGIDTRGVKYSVDTVEDLKVCARLLRNVGEGETWNEYVSECRKIVPRGTEETAL